MATVFRISASELAQQISEGRLRARQIAAETPNLDWCDEAQQQCLLQVIGERDIAIRELLGPPSSVTPASWPVAEANSCSENAAPSANDSKASSEAQL